MVGYDSVNRARPYTRKTYRTLRPHIRGRSHVKTKTRRINYLQRNIPLNTVPQMSQVHSKPTLVKVNNLQRRINKRTKKLANMHAKKQSRRKRKAKKRDKAAKEWTDIVKQINNPDIADNIGVYINPNNILVATEGEITEEQYDQLIEELQSNLEFADSAYEEKIINKAITFVEDSQKTPGLIGFSTNEPHENHNINSLEKMMAGLSTGR